MTTLSLIHAVVTLWLTGTLCLAQKAQPPKINSGFEKVIYFLGSSDQKVLDCTAEGIPAPTYEWYKDGQRVNNTTTVEVTGGKLDLKAPEYKDSGSYQCFAVNTYGKSASSVVNVVKGEIEGFPKKQITRESVIVGDHAVLTCREKPKSVPDATVDWSLSESDVVKTSERVVIDQVGSLHFINAQVSDMLPNGKTYNCSVYNDVIKQRAYGNPMMLIVNAASGAITRRTPSISYITSDAVALLGNNFTLQCIPDGYPLPKVRWFRMNGELKPDRHKVDPASYKLHIINVTENDEGDYKCEAYLDEDVHSATVFLDVKSEPVWVEKMRPITVTNGKTAEFNCVARSAIGETDAVDVQWFKNWVELQPGTRDKMTVSGTRLTVTDVIKPYSLMSVQCKVTNKIGYQLADAFLNVIENTIFTEKPKENMLIDPGKVVELRISAQADPLYASRLKYTWSFKGQPIKPSKYTYVNAANNLVINATELGKDEEFLKVLGNYSCYVSVGLGGEGDEVAYVHVASNQEAEILPPEEEFVWWWIAVIVGVALLILFIILIGCLVYRNRGNTYPVDERERRAGHDPEKELADNGVQDLSRADGVDEDKRYGDPDGESLPNPPIGGDTDSLDEYGEPDASRFNEDGSFIGNYGRKGQQNMNQSTL